MIKFLFSDLLTSTFRTVLIVVYHSILLHNPQNVCACHDDRLFNYGIKAVAADLRWQQH